MSNASFQTGCRSLILSFREEPPSKTPSLIATVFGDLVEAYGGEIWLGSLTRLLEPLGISERLVRTAVYRLSKDGSLEGTRIGRRSFYRLTPAARARVDRYDRRIYYFAEPQWDGEWRLLFAGSKGINANTRAEIRRRMIWLGYGIIAPNVYGHPNAPMEPLWQMLEELGIAQKVTIMRASNYDQAHGQDSREVARQYFDIGILEKEYRVFIKRYAKLAEALEREQEIGSNSEHSLMLRIMLIHQYRRILLHDPDLPAALLPDNWSGREAQRLCATLYRAVETQSNMHIRTLCENQKGPFKKVTTKHTRRFAVDSY